MTGALGDQQSLGNRLPAHDFAGAKGCPRPDHRFPVRPDSAGVIDKLVEPAGGPHIGAGDVQIHVVTITASAWPSRVTEVRPGDSVADRANGDLQAIRLAVQLRSIEENVRVR